MQLLISNAQLQLIINRLAQQLIENDDNIAETIFIGLQPRGIYVSDKLIEQIKILCPEEKVNYGLLDITFYRDDVRTEIHVPTLSGSSVNLKVPQYSQSGKTFRLKGLGMPHHKSEEKGDMYVKIKIMVPKELNEQEIDLFQQLKVLREGKDNIRQEILK